MCCMVLNSGMYSCILLWLATLTRRTETQLNISVGCTQCMGTALLQYNHTTSHKKVVVCFQDSYVMFSEQSIRIWQECSMPVPFLKLWVQYIHIYHAFSKLQRMFVIFTVTWWWRTVADTTYLHTFHWCVFVFLKDRQVTVRLFNFTTGIIKI